MTTKNLFTMLMLAGLTTASMNTTASAQGFGGLQGRFSKITAQKITAQKTQIPSKVYVPTLTTNGSGGVSFSEACTLMAPYKQWMIGANKTGFLYPKSDWNGPASQSYNLKGLENRKFLQYEKQGWAYGINIGWTDNASADTATAKSKWFFSRQSNSKAAIVYGEPLAMAWGNSKNSFVKYGHRTIGINLDWTSKPAYEWAILGGTPGQPVRRGVDRVILYNLKNKQPLIRFDRTKGGDIGWPDSKTWKDQAWDKVKKHVTMENVAKALLLAGAAL